MRDQFSDKKFPDGAESGDGSALPLLGPTLEAQNLPRLVVAPDLRVTGANIAARAAAAAGVGFSIGVDNRLYVSDFFGRNKLDVAISELGANRARSYDIVPLNDAERSLGRYFLVTRLPDPQAETAEPQQFMLEMRDLSHPIGMDVEALERGLDLTPMEARLCLALLNEVSLNEFAKQNKLKIATVRWHWGNIREKLGVHTQSALVRFLMRLRL